MADELRTLTKLELDSSVDSLPASAATSVPRVSPFTTARLRRIDTFTPRLGCETHRHCSYLVWVARGIGMLHIWIWLRPHKIEALRGARSGQLQMTQTVPKKENPAHLDSD